MRRAREQVSLRNEMRVKAENFDAERRRLEKEVARLQAQCAEMTRKNDHLGSKADTLSNEFDAMLASRCVSCLQQQFALVTL